MSESNFMMNCERASAAAKPWLYPAEMPWFSARSTNLSTMPRCRQSRRNSAESVARAVVHGNQFARRIAHRFQEGGNRRSQVSKPVMAQNDDRRLRRSLTAHPAPRRVGQRDVHRRTEHLSLRQRENDPHKPRKPQDREQVSRTADEPEVQTPRKGPPQPCTRSRKVIKHLFRRQAESSLALADFLVEFGTQDAKGAASQEAHHRVRRRNEFARGTAEEVAVGVRVECPFRAADTPRRLGERHHCGRQGG